MSVSVALTRLDFIAYSLDASPNHVIDALQCSVHVSANDLYSIPMFDRRDSFVHVESGMNFAHGRNHQWTHERELKFRLKHIVIGASHIHISISISIILFLLHELQSCAPVLDCLVDHRVEGRAAAS